MQRHTAGRASPHTHQRKVYRLSRICTELNKHLPPNAGLPSYCSLCIKSVEFTKTQSEVMNGTSSFTLLSRMFFFMSGLWPLLYQTHQRIIICWQPQICLCRSKQSLIYNQKCSALLFWLLLSDLCVTNGPQKRPPGHTRMRLLTVTHLTSVRFVGTDVQTAASAGLNAGASTSRHLHQRAKYSVSLSKSN